jgi:hypothetical protein
VKIEYSNPHLCKDYGAIREQFGSQIEMYKDPVLCYVFLMNNCRYMVSIPIFMRRVPNGLSLNFIGMFQRVLELGKYADKYGGYHSETR